MTGIIDALSGSFQHLAGDVARIAAATCISFLPDFFGKSERVGQRLLEYRVQEFDDELKRRFIVVVKDNLAIASLDLSITHRK